MALPTRITLRGGDWTTAVRNLQSWVDSVQNILTGNVRVGDQIGSTYSITWNSSSPSKLNVTDRLRPKSVRILEASLSGGTSSWSGVGVEWDWASTSSGSTIRILSAPSLALNTDWNILLLVLPGGD